MLSLKAKELKLWSKGQDPFGAKRPWTQRPKKFNAQKAQTQKLKAKGLPNPKPKTQKRAKNERGKRGKEASEQKKTDY